MVIVKFIQDGLKCQLEGETDTYKYSKNLEMQFVKDEDHKDYEVTVFFLDQEKNEGKIDIDENGVFKIGERFFLRKDPFYLSFQLKKGDEIQHLGNYKMRVCDAIGNGSSPLPEDPKIWIEYVDEEMDKYFNENFQPKLDKFNADYEEIKKIAAGGGSGSSITVDSELNSTSKNPVQNQAIYKEFSNLNKKVENIPTNFKKINNTEITGDGNIDIPIVNVDAELNETSTNAIQNQAVAKELAEKLSKNGLKTINGQSLVGSGNIELSAGDNDYELPIANNETLGGVQPVAKTDDMTQEVGVDESGLLFTVGQEWTELLNTTLTITEATTHIIENLTNDKIYNKYSIFVELGVNTLDVDTKKGNVSIAINNAKIGYYNFVPDTSSSSNQIQIYSDTKLKSLFQAVRVGTSIESNTTPMFMQNSVGTQLEGVGKFNLDFAFQYAGEIIIKVLGK